MTPPLLDRLRQDLPGEWRDLDALPGGAEFAWNERAIGIVALTIGEHDIVIHVYPRDGGERAAMDWDSRLRPWEELREAICFRVAVLALVPPKHGKPIPPVPTWATPALVTRHAERVAELTQSERYYREYLAAIDAERAILSTLTLGA